ncbi:hypothetical protein ACFE04_024353 [Oxalis oulophora]
MAQDMGRVTLIQIQDVVLNTSIAIPSRRLFSWCNFWEKNYDERGFHDNRFYYLFLRHVEISNMCNFFMWFGDVELNGWAKQLVIHLRSSCVEYDTKLMASMNEAAAQKETMRSMSEELAKMRVELDLL